MSNIKFIRGGPDTDLYEAMKVLGAEQVSLAIEQFHQLLIIVKDDKYIIAVSEQKPKVCMLFIDEQEMRISRDGDNFEEVRL